MISSKNITFSIIVVCLNPGDSLIATINSILEQTYSNYEIIVKDGMSSDSSLTKIPTNDRRIKVFREADDGIYSAMNQAIAHANGRFVLFLNCGDLFFDPAVLDEISKVVSDERAIYYGDCYTRNRGYILRYPKIFNDYVCLTKTLCHQSTIYPLRILRERPFDSTYTINADFEYYVNAYCKRDIRMLHIDKVISNYEGGGLSDNPKSRKISIKQSKHILKSNLGKNRYRSAKAKAELHLFTIKQWLSSLSWFRPFYEKIAIKHYKKENDYHKNNK